jgi:hypothetical protein
MEIDIKHKKAETELIKFIQRILKPVPQKEIQRYFDLYKKQRKLLNP